MCQTLARDTEGLAVCFKEGSGRSRLEWTGCYVKSTYCVLLLQIYLLSALGKCASWWSWLPKQKLALSKDSICVS